MDIRLALMCGTDIPIPECQLTVHQPRIKEISFIGEQTFFTGIQCLCLNKTMFIEDKTVLDNTTNFQIFMMVMSEKEAKDKKSATIQVLKLLFPNYKVILTPQSITFMKENSENLLIDDNNFEILQDVLRKIFCAKDGPMDQQAFNPGNKKAKEIAEKLMRGRQRIAEEKGENNASVFSQYISSLTVGVPSMSLQSLIDLTMYQLYDLIERYILYINWDIDIKGRLAGAKSDNQPDNWMKNIH